MLLYRVVPRVPNQFQNNRRGNQIAQPKYTVPKITYKWQVGEFTNCSLECGGGKVRISVFDQINLTLKYLLLSYCNDLYMHQFQS